jgi:hypothetical protein
MVSSDRPGSKTFVERDAIYKDALEQRRTLMGPLFSFGGEAQEKAMLLVPQCFEKRREERHGVLYVGVFGNSSFGV